MVQVGDEVWSVFYVVGFVVVVVQVCEDVGYFQMVLCVYLFECVVEFVEVVVYGQFGGVGCFLVVYGLIELLFFVL